MHPSRLDQPPGFPHPVAGLLSDAQGLIDRRLRSREVPSEPFRPAQQPESVALVGRIAALGEEPRQRPHGLERTCHVAGLQLGFREVHAPQPVPVPVPDPARSLGCGREMGSRLSKLTGAQPDEPERV